MEIIASLHVKDSDFVLEEGLSPNLVKLYVYSRTGHPCKDDFETFGKLIGLNEVQVQKALHSFTGSDEQVKQLISNSYLDERSKRMYLRTYEERVSRFNRIN